jgi:AraC-like DNA-binding protein
MFMTETGTRNAAVQPKPQGARLQAAPGQPTPTGAGRQLFGGFADLGVGVEWHDFRAPAGFDWASRFRAESLELCLNVSGEGTIGFGGKTLGFAPSTTGFYLPGKRELVGSRAAGQQHQFISVTFSRQFLRRHLLACDGGLHPQVEAFLQGSAPCAGVGEVRGMSPARAQSIADLLRPPVAQAARPIWYQSRVLELMVDFFFERPAEEELLCDRQKRLARERVERVVAVLRQHLAEPPSLAEIGRAAGCSPFYLSRTFSRETGLTIPQYLRKLRMERAAELLRSGNYNVTEAALEVGYSSLSHFSQAFCQTMGVCPGLYPLRPAPTPAKLMVDRCPFVAK